ncbi:unnamed protein product [Ilex paraguariensis]|uniref:Uncharacterized protein n=1 Tax=Ilex paraguariensis TaxID=185542 RepID=A0ABC8RQA1_9AQUA
MLLKILVRGNQISKLYTIYKYSPVVSGQTKAVLTLNSFQKGADGGGPSECDHKYHSDDKPVVALSTGWYYRGSSVTPLWDVTKTMINSLHVLITSLMPQKAVWKTLGVPEDEWGELDITWSDA